MPFLGLVYDTVKMSIELPQDKLDSITLLVGTWMNTSSATKTTLQSLIGKLAFVSTCNSPGHIFMQRLLNKLHMLTHKQQLLHGTGGFYEGFFFYATYPHFITKQSLHINTLEIHAVTVSIKLWAFCFALSVHPSTH